MVVGLACAGLHNAVMIGGDLAGLHYAVSSVLSYLIVVVVGFALHVRYTFGQPARFAAFWRYAVTMAANYPATLLLLFLMCDVAGLPVVVAAPAATVVMFAWNYVASRWAILRPAA
jgi:putative flippase GtrA